MEDELAKGAMQACKSDAQLWSVAEQVIKGRLKRSAPKKEIEVTSATRRTFISKGRIKQAQG